VNAIIVNTLVEAALQALQSMGHVGALVGKPKRVEELPAAPALCAAVSLHGNVEAHTCWSFDHESLRILCGILFPGMDPVAGDVPPEDMVGEIANIIAGIATGLLEQAGMTVYFKTPDIIRSGATPMSLVEPGVEIPLQLTEGIVRVVVGRRLYLA